MYRKKNEMILNRARLDKLGAKRQESYCLTGARLFHSIVISYYLVEVLQKLS